MSKRTRIVFDNDGVNIDSEDLAMRIMDDEGVKLIRKYKPDAVIPPDYIYTTYPGTSTDKIVEALIKKYDLPEDKIRNDFNISATDNVSVALADHITLVTNRRFERGLKAIPGITKALEEIVTMFGQENVALMTTSRADRMKVSLDHATDPATGKNARLAELFPAGDRRRSGYGHSNKYDEGFGALGWNPDETIVVEDSRSGVTKAMAGRPNVAVIGTVAAKFYTDKKDQATKLLADGAKLVISDVADLPKAAAWIMADMAPDQEPNWKGPVYTPKRGGIGKLAAPALGQG